MSDVYVVIHLAATSDETGTYVGKDASEITEFSWSLVDAASLDTTDVESVLVKPVSTPITPSCYQMFKISWEQVKNAGTFKDAISKFDAFMQQHVILQHRDFSLVTYDVSKLRVDLLREARDKAVVLPPYLQHPRVFDLQSEYAKWQLSHPEALSYSASSLTNIITALEVDVVESSEELSAPNSIMSTPPVSSMSSNSNTSDPTDSLNGHTRVPAFGQQQNYAIGTQDAKRTTSVGLYTNMLTQLIKKSLPLRDHANVLVRPYDSTQDVKMFLSERSKILYLSNLPSDTTQSELESWFTQYGGRPIAFWALKTFDLGDTNRSLSVGGSNVGANNRMKGIVGFAVFASHEEATEALAMNGRALNDRAIEVQPSSTKVLDKASDLLTPFPPSKNRPRPGDWTCPSCGFSNFQRRTACFRCSFPATSAVTIQESMFSGNSIGGRRNGNTNSHSTNNKSSDKQSMSSSVCAAAAAMNASQGYHSYPDQYGTNHPSSNGTGMNNHHHHSSGHTYNNNRSYGTAVPFRAGDWKCSVEACQYHNFAKNLCCLRCGSARPSNTQGNNDNSNVGITSLPTMNSTAAAIAAATASGQSLNLSNTLMNLQLPQPQHVPRYGQIANQGQQGHLQQRHNSHGNGYATKGQISTNYSGLGAPNNVSGNNSHQTLPTQLMLLQQQQHQQQQQQQIAAKSGGQSKYSQSLTSPNGYYSDINCQQTQYAPYFRSNLPNPSHSAPVFNNSQNSPRGLNLGQEFPPSLNVLSTQMNSLDLNSEH